ncbi:MAG: hypothetical protein KF819_33590 [Labilithrix sp.]|nr:hypothetical protein [Labilithrix sp.]
MRRSLFWIGGIVVAAGAFGSACSSAADCEADSCAGPPVSPDGGEGGPDRDTGAPPIDPCVETPTDPKCLDEASALFVSASTGNDQTGDGSRSKPYNTVGHALGKIEPGKRRIYVCEGTYAEDLTLGATHSGVSLLGGLTCAWSASPEKPVVGASATPLTIDGASGLAIVGLAVVAKDAPSGSSVAAFVKGGDVTFKSVKLEAGTGGKGDDGVTQGFTNFPTQSDLNGNNAVDGTTGGPEKPHTCPGGSVTKGGKGGDIGNFGATGTPGPANGGLLADCSGNVTGTAGTTGTGGAGAARVGALLESGWAPEQGENGIKGGPGQGGGGGFGIMGAGGSGGAGGCGGAGGAAGKGGGASIALAAHAARIKITSSTLLAKGGGAGGKGAAGQDGQTIFGFRGNGSGNACNGGAGGPGGNGGAGGGGAGGSSIGVSYRGTKPELDAETEAQIAVGAKGGGGQLAGMDGASEKWFQSK